MSLYLCFNFLDFLLLSFWWVEHPVVYTNMPHYKAWLLQLSLAFRYSAWLFTLPIHKCLGWKTNWLPDTFIYVSGRKAKLASCLHIMKWNDLCCTLLPNVKMQNPDQSVQCLISKSVIWSWCQPLLSRKTTTFKVTRNSFWLSNS